MFCQTEDCRMMRKVSWFYGTPICAVDGELGNLYDFYFDDRSWQIRYLAAELGSWFKSKQVLISPAALATFDGFELKVQLTREEISNCPDSDVDKPVNLQQRERTETLDSMVQSFSGLSGGPGAAPFPILPSPNDLNTDNRWNQHLRSSLEILRYQLCAQDGTKGKIEDLLFDDRPWIIRSILIRLDEQAGHDIRILDPSCVDRIEVVPETIHVGCGSDYVLCCPIFDPLLHVNISYESFLNIYNSMTKTYNIMPP
jgi:hypothetical protein